MRSKLNTDRGSELFTMSRGMIRMQFRNLKLRYRFKLRKVDLNVLADEMAIGISQVDMNLDWPPAFPPYEDSSPELQLLFSPFAQKRRN